MDIDKATLTIAEAIASVISQDEDLVEDGVTFADIANEVDALSCELHERVVSILRSRYDLEVEE